MTGLSPPTIYSSFSLMTHKLSAMDLFDVTLFREDDLYG